VAVREGRIVYVGSDVGARAFVGPKTRAFPLGGRLVLPAFQDAHIHPVSGGVELGQCNINDLATKEAILEKVRACAATEKKPWIVGGGWPLPAFPDANPTKEMLDAVVPDRPVFLSAADGHSGWANSKALELAGITASTPDPTNGRIERDASGAPTGTLREAAQRLVDKLIPEPTPEEHIDGCAARSIAERLRVTAVYEANAGADRRRASPFTYREANGGPLTSGCGGPRTDARGAPSRWDNCACASSYERRPVAARSSRTASSGSDAAMLENYDDRRGSAASPFGDAAPSPVADWWKGFASTSTPSAIGRCG
jgi:predicted amidohydrolase YtcJ